MRLAMATLADTANIREGMINVLSAGITEMWRREFPAPLAVVLPLLVEVAPGDRVEELDLEARLVRRVEDGNDQQVASLSGKIRMQGEAAPLTNIPTILNLKEALLPEPGEYYVRVNVGGLVWTDIPFRAHQLPKGE